MSKVENKRKHPENETGEKPPQKKIFTAKNEGVKKPTEGKKDFKKGDGKKEFKKGDGKKDFKNGDGKKDFKNGDGKKDFKKSTDNSNSTEKKSYSKYSKDDQKEGKDKKAFKS